MELLDVISVTPAMRVNCFSRGVATDTAIISGLAPGREALTRIVGKSIWGNGELRIRNGAGQCHRDSQQRGGNRPGDKRGRNAHGLSWFYEGKNVKAGFTPDYRYSNLYFFLMERRGAPPWGTKSYIFM